MSGKPNHALASGKLLDPPSLDGRAGLPMRDLKDMKRHGKFHLAHTDMHSSTANFVFRHLFHKRWQSHAFTLPGKQLGGAIDARSVALIKPQTATDPASGLAA